MQNKIPLESTKKAYKDQNKLKKEQERIEDGRVLVDPIFRQQSKEADPEYALFLIYRDLPWDIRSKRLASAVALGVHENTVKYPHTAIVNAYEKWQWQVRVNAYDLFLQEARSDRQEKIVQQTKSDIEHIVMRMVSKIKRIENITKAEDLTEPEIVRDMAVIQVMIDKGNIGKWLLDAYKTILGQKMQISTPKALPQLEWK